ncbi:MAG: HIT family protein [Flavobacteriales bacterium]|jgi:histidine triad (HIT) family protein|nr:HIT family protein [Flavobacteriales bacterium]MCW8914004.1 HIT family protein [Flavobacteriales bacterium]MCW8937743.1 HIT family protein [Flavobacteriales bacterium]MCW8940502.1 HIT family protein [Flavobacteriales bacterium]MCW8967924.1 HIT family protein [Flavobacteriales bacterium]
MSTIFTKIINGEIPCYKIAENEKFLAFLDISPLAKGHTLVIPKKEVDYIFDISSPTYQELWSFAQITAKMIEKAIPCKRIGVAVIGLEVPHAHIHLVPINNVGDINFSKEKLSLSTEEMKVICDKITRA